MTNIRDTEVNCLTRYIISGDAVQLLHNYILTNNIKHSTSLLSKIILSA